MTNKKQIHIVCKSNTEDKYKLVHEFWARLLDKTDVGQVSKDLIVQSVMVAEKETIETSQCKWFYCPAYHFCPFSDEVLPGIRGRADKKKFYVKFENLNTPKTPLAGSDFGFRDGVIDEVIRGILDPENDETM